MIKCRFVCIILVYRNVNDLIECIESMQSKIPSCQIIVVNAFYDDISRKQIEQVAMLHNCDFINIDNKGYSYGNNVGIRYANNNYDYEFLIVSNPDILIEKFDDELLDENRIYAPCIIAKSGKRQNPMAVHRNRVSEYLIYKGLKTNLKSLTILGLAMGKAARIIGQSFKPSSFEIYQAHGSFVILHRKVIEKLEPIYDENMFLFAEEGVLALKANNANIKTLYTEDIVIHHKEDGSMSMSNFKVNDELKKANVYFYETYCRGD